MWRPHHACCSGPAGGAGQLSRLESLQLAGNRLPSWECVNCLDAFPALRDLRLSGNPCLEGQDVVTCRLEVRLA